MSENNKKETTQRTNPLAGNALFGTHPEITQIAPLPAQLSPLPSAVQPTQSKVDRPTPPSQRVRSSLSYTQRYTKETVHIDNRLHDFYLQLLGLYPNNTVAINEIILKACIGAGLDVPPDLLKKPYEK